MLSSQALVRVGRHAGMTFGQNTVLIDETPYGPDWYLLKSAYALTEQKKLDVQTHSMRTCGDGVFPTLWFHENVERSGTAHYVWQTNNSRDGKKVIYEKIVDGTDGGEGPYPENWARSPSQGIPNLANAWNPIAVDFSYCDTAALNGLTEAKFELGIFLIELRDSVKMLIRQGTSLAKALRAVKKGDVAYLKKRFGPKPASVKNDSASLWLYYSFFIRPLLSDVNDLSNLVKNGLDSDSLYVVSEGRTKVDLPESSCVNNLTSDITSAKGMRYQKTKMMAKFPSVTRQRLSALGLVNLPAVAYEGVPFSFAVDWVYPLGSWLRALSSTEDLEFIGGYRSVFQETEVHDRYVRGYRRDYLYKYAYRTDSFDMVTRTRLYHRRPFYTFPAVPPIRMRNPFAHRPTAITAAALVTSLTSKR